jgi:segregation and condensation protein B
MPPSPEPPFESQPQGISLDELAEAFAQVMGNEPRQPADVTAEAAAVESTSAAVEVEAAADGAPSATAESPTPEPVEEDACPISPRSILEAMLFVGNRENRPLSPARAAELMRDVATEEIPPLVDELNQRYVAAGSACRIIGEGEGYRLTLCAEMDGLRNRFYGRVREARLSQAAIDVLALVAYQQPATAETIGQLRGKPSNAILMTLVRRGLLRIERLETKKRTPHYHTTERFLRLFNLQTLDDLPRGEDTAPA